MTDRIDITLTAGEKLTAAISHNLNYICSETLTDNLRISDDRIVNALEIELVEGVSASVSINRKY